jgi:hypothetical protein
MNFVSPPPFALSLSKGFPSLAYLEEGEGFDTLSANGFLIIQNIRAAGGKA